MLGCSAKESLHQEEQGDHKEEPRTRALGRRKTHLTWLLESNCRRFLGVPTDLATPTSVDGKQDPGATD